MSEIICPSCKKTFKVDNTDYSEIVKQVRDKEFEKQTEKNKQDAEKNKQAAISLIKAQATLDNNAQTKKSDKQIAALKSDLSKKDLEKDNLKKSLETKYLLKLKDKDVVIKYKDDEITLIQDMKQKFSTKMLGESLEHHCEIEFNKLRATAFPTAEFNKDNDASSGTKGDFIYRENDDLGNEIISIMFEMKNEDENTADKNKKKNEDFFKKLDKDRKNKKCEYAILVSLLESDNDLYNTGIVDVFYKFEKMYVVRPQFFIPIISLLRNSAQKSLKYKQEIEVMKNQEVDITNFENKISTFRDGFSKNYESASNNFNEAIEEIDKSIKRMKAVKSKLLTSENQLRLADDKTQDLTIKKLTHGNATMKQKFNDVSST